MSSDPIRVLIAEDSPVTSAALTELLADLPGEFAVAGVVADSAAAVALAGRTRPDVALLDVRMPGGGGPAATLGIRDVSPDTRVVAYSAADDRESVMAMLRGGAKGYVLKGTGSADLLAALRTCAAGGTSLSGDLSHHLLHDLAERTESERVAELASRDVVSRMRRLLSEGAMQPVYQPIVDLATGATVGFEALARFDSGERPDLVFERAHSLGLGVDLELHAMAVQISQFRQLLRSAEGLYLAINASATTLLRAAAYRLLSPHPGESRMLEITEHSDEEADSLQAAVKAARRLNISVAVDDAGAGFSGLTRIAELRPEVVKLDRALVTGLDQDSSKRAIVAAMVGYSGATDTIIVAEGIETERELAILRDLGVSRGQGFLLGRPQATPQL